MHAFMYVERLPALINLAMQLRIMNLLLCICARCLLKVNTTLLPPLILHLAIELWSVISSATLTSLSHSIAMVTMIYCMSPFQ